VGARHETPSKPDKVVVLGVELVQFINLGIGLLSVRPCGNDEEPSLNKFPKVDVDLQELTQLWCGYLV